MPHISVLARLQIFTPQFLLLLFYSRCCSLSSPFPTWCMDYTALCFFSLTDIVYVSLDRDSPPTDVLELSRVLITSNVLHGVKELGVISTFPKRLYKAGVFFSSRG